MDIADIQGLTVKYGNFVALQEFTCRLKEGCTGLLGPNGAGKTTLMRCASSILVPTAGTVTINGNDLYADPVRAKQGLAFVPEVPNLYELLTVDEHLRFVAMCFKTLEVYEREGDELLRRYSLLEKKRDLVATLSKGMRQKLSIACAMVHRANVFLFDEPMIGIDPAGVAEFKAEMLEGRANGNCYLVSTHLLDVAEKLCDRVVIMARGQKVAEGTVAELRDRAQMESADLEKLFLSLTNPETTDAPPVIPG
ncbi:MAG: ABC transporter ATP-binding protein [Armatimonadetes bacterium]|nr:ABC transporter ATP-binding protein [Armatimonadota bacterium]